MNKEDAAQRESARNPYLLRAGILDNTDPCVNARNGEVRDDIFKERFHWVKIVVCDAWWAVNHDY